MMIKQLTTSLATLSVPLLLIPASLRAQETPPSPADLRTQAMLFLQPLPDKMPGAENDTPARVELGKTLFFEKRLSLNNTQSCNTCHSLDKGRGGVDNEPTSPGALGGRGSRNSPTVLNAGYHIAQFWDGRAATLEDQAKGPILNPVEMAMPEEKVVIERLSPDPVYQKAFAEAFPGEENPINYDNLAKAIAAFERTLRTNDRFDDFLKGDDAALSDVEREGLQLFISTGCVTCHMGPAVGGSFFQKMGLLKPYSDTKDTGREAVTGNEAEKFFFKVPSLRNIALTAPYFHDGAAKTLEEAIETMADIQLGKTLSKDETRKIAAFLRSLTDKQRGADADAAAKEAETKTSSEKQTADASPKGDTPPSGASGS